jgi:hypothetical protein
MGSLRANSRLHPAVSTRRLFLQAPILGEVVASAAKRHIQKKGLGKHAALQVKAACREIMRTADAHAFGSRSSIDRAMARQAQPRQRN